MLTCDKCAGTIQNGANFCPHCGDPVTEADRPVSAVAVSGTAQVEIIFGRSTSASYEQAVKIAKNIPTYSEEGEGKSTHHSVVLPMTEVELVINLWELVGNWKTSKLLINGQPATKKALVYKSVGCFRERQKSYNRDQYCYGDKQYDSNIWGCKQLQLPLSQWGGGWLEYGEMTKSGVWVVDKKRIRHELERRLHENELCPVLDPAKVYETLDSFPDKINPKKDPDWDYDTRYEDVKGRYQDVAVGIKPVVKRASRYVLGDYRPTWDFEIDTGADYSEDTDYEIEETSSSRKKRGSQKKKKGGCLKKIGCAVVAIIFIIIVAGILGGDSS